MKVAGYAIAALILVFGSLVSVSQLIGLWLSGECRVLWEMILVRRDERPVWFHVVMVAWTVLSLALNGLAMAGAYLLARIAFG